MRPIRTLTTHDPEFLKTVYNRTDIDLLDHERHIPTGDKYITYGGLLGWKWRVWRMTRERVPIPLGAFISLNYAICEARKK